MLTIDEPVVPAVPPAVSFCMTHCANACPLAYLQWGVGVLSLDIIKFLPPFVSCLAMKRKLPRLQLCPPTPLFHASSDEEGHPLRERERFIIAYSFCLASTALLC